MSRLCTLVEGKKGFDLSVLVGIAAILNLERKSPPDQGNMTRALTLGRYF